MSSDLTVTEMCDGCGWQRKNLSCKVFTEPDYIYKHRKSKCFAKVTPERAKRIEFEIKMRNNKEII